jgi:hypothetical protein
MPSGERGLTPCGSAATSFEQLAPGIMYRWSAERDVSITAEEMEQSRAYLRQLGIATTPLPDGRFLLDAAGTTIEGARLVLLSFRHCVARRVERRR